MLSGLWDLILYGICSILFFICKWLLRFVELVELFFNVFAGTEKILYGDEKTYLINIFFGHDAVTNAFWGMAIIAMILSIGFTIVALARKVTDVSGTTKHTIGQIVSNFIRSMLAILLLNICVVASINVANVLLDQIDFALTNAEVLDVETGARKVDEAEYAAMTRILATVANYNVNKGAETRYNINACFNAIRTDLQALQSRGFFEYEYAMTPSGHHTWQTALAFAANAADLSVDLNLNQYYPQVDEAITLLAKELATNPEFKPVAAGTKEAAVAPNVKVMLFLVSSFGAEHNAAYRNGSMDDALRRSYLNETKDCTDVDTVEKDFDITEINYILLLAGSYIFLMLMLTCIIQFIERLFNLVLFYITGPLFASSMSLDEGGKFQSWLQGFVLQLLGAFGTVFVMRIYLIIMPVLSGSAIVFFPSTEGFWGTTINYMAQLILIIGGAFAVSKANSIIFGALSGNSAMAAGHQLGEATALAGGVTKMGAMQAAKAGGMLAAKGGMMAAKGSWAAAKMAADPLRTARRAGNAVAGAAMGVAGAAAGAWEGTKTAFRNNQTLGAIGRGIDYMRNRPKVRMGGSSTMSKDTGVTGSKAHSGGFGQNRPNIPIVRLAKRQSKDAPASSSIRRPTLESMTGGTNTSGKTTNGTMPGIGGGTGSVIGGGTGSVIGGGTGGGTRSQLPKQMPGGRGTMPTAGRFHDV